MVSRMTNRDHMALQILNALLVSGRTPAGVHPCVMAVHYADALRAALDGQPLPAMPKREPPPPVEPAKR
jgi:hypothetical protein